MHTLYEIKTYKKVGIVALTFEHANSLRNEIYFANPKLWRYIEFVYLRDIVDVRNLDLIGYVKSPLPHRSHMTSEYERCVEIEKECAQRNVPKLSLTYTQAGPILEINLTEVLRPR